MRRSILALAATCFCVALCAQNNYNIGDSDNTLKGNELACIKQMVDYELTFYNKVFGQGAIRRDSVRMTVLKDYPTYMFYLDKAGIKMPAGSGGVFASKLNELVIWRGNRGKDQFLSTCYHELSHAMLRSKVKDPLPWYNEGLATWFEKMRVSPTSVRPPQTNSYYLTRVKTIIETGDLDLKDFITWDNGKFSQVSFTQDAYGYAIAYCMISLLMKDNEEALTNIIRMVAGGTGSAVAFDLCYPGGFAAFEKAFLAAYS